MKKSGRRKQLFVTFFILLIFFLSFSIPQLITSQTTSSPDASVMSIFKVEVYNSGGTDCTIKEGGVRWEVKKKGTNDFIDVTNLCDEADYSSEIIKTGMTKIIYCKSERIFPKLSDHIGPHTVRITITGKTPGCNAETTFTYASSNYGKVTGLNEEQEGGKAGDGSELKKIINFGSDENGKNCKEPKDDKKKCESINKFVDLAISDLSTNTNPLLDKIFVFSIIQRESMKFYQCCHPPFTKYYCPKDTPRGRENPPGRKVQCEEGDILKSCYLAIGLMQVLKSTAAGEGVLNPYNARDNIKAGVSYINKQLNRYNDRELALAAYNWGSGNLAGAISNYGHDWKKIYPHAPRETQNYVTDVMKFYRNKNFDCSILPPKKDTENIITIMTTTTPTTSTTTTTTATTKNTCNRCGFWIFGCDERECNEDHGRCWWQKEFLGIFGIGNSCFFCDEGKNQVKKCGDYTKDYNCNTDNCKVAKGKCGWNGGKCIDIVHVKEGKKTNIIDNCDKDEYCHNKYKGVYKNANLLECNYDTKECIWCVDGDCNGQDCTACGGSCIGYSTNFRCKCNC